MLSQERINQIAYDIVGCAIEVHKNLGPGLLESVYEKCLIEELNSKKFNVKQQVHIPIKYKMKTIDANLMIDLLIENLIIVELKAVEKLLPIHSAQLLTYLKLTKKPN